MIGSYFKQFTEYTPTDWVSTKKGEVHKALLPLFKQLDSDNLPRERQMWSDITMYTSQKNYTNLFGAARMLDAHIESSVEQKLVWNIVKSCIDTLAAKIAKNRVKVQLITEDADYSYQRRALKLDRAIYALQLQNNWHRAAKRAFYDAAICGTGIIQVIQHGENISYERIQPWEMFVDPMDALNGQPTRFYRWKMVTKEKLLQTFPKHTDAINKLQGHTLLGGIRCQESLPVFEAYYTHKTEGRHTICIEGVDLLDEKHDDTNPFIFLKFTNPISGFWGISLAHELSAFQLAINRVLYYTDKSIEVNHAAKWLVKTGSVPKKHIRNQIGDILSYDGTKPDFIAPQPINPQVISYLQMLKQEAYAIVGISALSSQSVKPAGLNSGKALQTYNDIETERFQLLGQAYEEFTVDCFNATVNVCKQLAEKNPDFTVLASTGQGLEKTEWKQIDMEKDAYIVTPYPVSALPQEPAARFQFLTEQMKAGLITPEEFSELNEMPDFKASAQLKYASYYSAKTNIENILDGKPYMQPEKYDNLKQMLNLTTNAYLSARKDNTPEPVLEALRTYIDDIQSLIESIQASAAAPANMAPQGVPAAPPTAELLPVAPGG